MPQASDGPSIDGLHIDGLTIVRRLAVGGMAEVFAATQAAAGDAPTTPVVVKRLLPHADDTWRTLFARERDALAAIDSPHVVRLLGHGQDYLILELVDGPDLGALLDHLQRRGRSLPIGAAAAVVDGILAGLADLHEATAEDDAPLGLVHRDINPANVLVSGSGEVKLTDLGVVTRSAVGHQTTAGLKGTLPYMAPEQLAGREVDQRADVYGAGLVAFETLTGVPARPPVAGLAELLEARSRLPMGPSELNPTLPAELDAVVLAALEPAAGMRPTNGRELLGRWRDACRAAGVAPDQAQLGRLATEVGTRTSSSGGGLAATLAPDRPLARVDAVHPRGASGRWILVIPFVIIAAAAVILTALLLDRDDREKRRPPEPDAEIAQIHRIVPVSLDDVGEEDPDPGWEEDAADVAEPAPDDGPEVLRDARPQEPDADMKGDVAAGGDSDAPDVAAAAAPDGAADDAVKASVATPPAPWRVDVAPAGSSSLYVKGGGVQGLGRQRVRLSPGKALLLTVRGGSPPLTAKLRLTRKGERVRVTVGAPGRSFHTVSCGGAAKPTPYYTSLKGTSKRRCKVTASDGSRSFGFTLRRL